MYICWGTKVFRKKSGLAADFCPICRGASVVDVEEIRSQPHIYYVGLGAGTVVGHACRCHSCETEWALQEGTIRGAVSSVLGSSLEALILQTFPRFDIIYGDRMQQEAEIRRNPLSLNSDVRLSLIAEPFFLLEGDMQSESSKNNTWQHNVGILAGVAAFILGVVGLFTLTDNFPPIGYVEIFVALCLGIWSYRLSVAAHKRFMDTRIYPRLARCLTPLRPSEEELSIVLHGVSTKCAKQTKLKDFLPLLGDARSTIVVSPPLLANSQR